MEIAQPPARILRMVRLATGDTIDLPGAHFAGVDMAGPMHTETVEGRTRFVHTPKKVRFDGGHVQPLSEIRAAGYEVYAITPDPEPALPT